VSRPTVAVDGRPLQDEVLGGVGRHLAMCLPRVAAEVDLVLLTDPRSPPAAIDVAQVPIRVPDRLPGLAWLELGVGSWLARQPSVLFHGAYYAMPLRSRGPAVTAFYDISWETHPEDFGAAKRRVWRRYGRHAAAHSAVLLTISEFCRDQIVSTYGVDPARVVLTRCVVDPIFHPGQADRFDEVAARLGIRRPYVATLGGAARRGLPEAVSAWRRASAATGLDIDLVVVGAEAPPEEPGIHWVGRIDDDSWATVLAAAEVLVYATRFEGYGLPAAEAIASGTPVVCAPVGALPEVVLDAGAWASAPTGGALGRRLAELLTDPADAAARRARGLEVAALTTLDQLVDATVAAYDLAGARDR
jgi:glycosyltransferase involved in cell wall biosynthesis